MTTETFAIYYVDFSSPEVDIAINSDPDYIYKNNDTAWFGLGLIFWINQDFDESIVFVKKALKLDNKNSEYWLTLGKINNDYNQKENAIKALKQAARIDSENTEIWITWVDVFLKNDEPKNAIRILKRGIKAKVHG